MKKMNEQTNHKISENDRLLEKVWKYYYNFFKIGDNDAAI